MKNLVAYAATAAVLMTVPAFADVSGTKAVTSKSGPVAASVRTSSVTFDLDAKTPVTNRIAPQDSEGLFAAENEVKLEDYSFKLQ